MITTSFVPTLQGEVASSWSNKRLIVAQDLIGRLSEKLGLPLTALGSLTGAQLAGCQYRHPLFERTSPVVIGGDYITTESGTGLVHTAPGHGQEDYQVRFVVVCVPYLHHLDVIKGRYFGLTSKNEESLK